MTSDHEKERIATQETLQSDGYKNFIKEPPMKTDKLPRCPFCQCKMILDGNFYEHPDSKCVMQCSALHVESDMANLWNTRAHNPAMESYARHFADPVAAAQSDRLGEVLECLQELLFWESEESSEEIPVYKQAWDKARAILSQRRG